MIEIPITQGLVTLIDDSDYYLVSEHKWSLHRSNHKLYARGVVNGKRIYLHRFLMNAPDDMEVDHVNGDGLYNLRTNLELVTHAEQQQRFRRLKTGTTSKYRGVSWAKRERLWVTRIIKNQKLVYQAYSKLEIDAATKYDQNAVLFFGHRAQLNFK